mmetsp:Transcript_5240/g.9205  ORF Transcript_5240/g.9205 Transcript_5240/m.9205 type:complete len:436 (-) Transcript_5240:1035-2342(-)
MMNHSERSTSCGSGENAATTRQKQEFLELLRDPSVLGSVEQRVHAGNDDDKVENKSSCHDAPLVTPLQASALSNIPWELYSRRTACLGRKGPNDDSEKVKHGESSKDYQQRACSERPPYSHLDLRIRQNTQWATQRLERGIMYMHSALSPPPLQVAQRWKDAQYEKAARCYQDGLDLCPNYVELLVAKGALEANRSCYDKSISLLRNAIRIDPNCSNANSYLEAVLEKKQRHNQKQRDQGSNINGALMKLRADQAMQDAIAERAFLTGGAVSGNGTATFGNYDLLSDSTTSCQAHDDADQSNHRDKKKHNDRKRGHRRKRHRSRARHYSDDDDSNNRTEYYKKRKHRRKENNDSSSDNDDSLQLRKRRGDREKKSRKRRKSKAISHQHHSSRSRNERSRSNSRYELGGNHLRNGETQTSVSSEKTNSQSLSTPKS